MARKNGGMSDLAVWLVLLVKLGLVVWVIVSLHGLRGDVAGLSMNVRSQHSMLDGAMTAPGTDDAPRGARVVVVDDFRVGLPEPESPSPGYHDFRGFNGEKHPEVMGKCGICGAIGPIDSFLDVKGKVILAHEDGTLVEGSYSDWGIRYCPKCGTRERVLADLKLVHPRLLTIQGDDLLVRRAFGLPNVEIIYPQ